MNTFLRKLLGFNNYDLDGTPTDKVAWRADGLPVNLYITPEAIDKAFIGVDYKTIYHSLQKLLTYERDIERFKVTERWQWPGEYQANNFKGDCEDSSLWYASALEANSIPYKVVIGCYGNYWKRKRIRNAINHVWVMVRDKKRWMLVETTSKTALIERADRNYSHVPRISFDAKQFYVHEVKDADPISF